MTERRLPKTAVENLVEDLASKANADLSNLDATGQAKFDAKANIALTNSPYTTNRILEIPQDIKLELNDGTLTLKAGSKVYVPNGSGNFDVITTTQDYAADTSAYSGLYVLGISTTTGLPNGITTIQDCVSGGTAPSSPTVLQGWYDTTNNVIKRYSGGAIQTTFRCSFPLCSVTSNGTKITSIDQIFNGFGYIGSTVFVLPGVKCEFPNGLNSDGTCRSIIATVDSVKTITRSDSITSNIHWYLTSNLSAFSSNIWSFDADKNIYVYPTGVGIIVEIARGYLTSGKITSFEPYTVDSVLNSNEFYQLKDKAVTTDTAQTISGVKTFSNNALQALRPVLLKEDNANEGGQIHFQRSNNSVLKDNPFIDLLINTIRFIGVNSNNTVNITLQVDLENNWVFVPTPEVASNNTQAATTAWVNSKMQVVSALPANPDPNVFYFIPG